MLDEIDKLGMDFRGDPASALLEVLDPEQNVAFRDHYIDVAFDLSKVLFITTANVLDTVPAPLRDRMEIIELAGYTEEEKVRIARKHLVPKQVERSRAGRGVAAAAGPTGRCGCSCAATRARPGCGTSSGRSRRSRARWPSAGSRATPMLVEVTEALVGELLGAPKFMFEELEERTRVPGVAIGLAWTPAGGDILFIEATRMKGSKTLTLTGQLGDVMKESAQAALSWVRSHAVGARHPVRLLGDLRHPRARPGGRHSQGRPVGRRHDGDGARVADDSAARAIGSGDDRRGDAVRPRAAGGRHQGEGPRRPGEPASRP